MPRSRSGSSSPTSKSSVKQVHLSRSSRERSRSACDAGEGVAASAQSAPQGGHHGERTARAGTSAGVRARPGRAGGALPGDGLRADAEGGAPLGHRHATRHVRRQFHRVDGHRGSLPGRSRQSRRVPLRPLHRRLPRPARGHRDAGAAQRGRARRPGSRPGAWPAERRAGGFPPRGEAAGRHGGRGGGVAGDADRSDAPTTVEFHLPAAPAGVRLGSGLVAPAERHHGDRLDRLCGGGYRRGAPALRRLVGRGRGIGGPAGVHGGDRRRRHPGAGPRRRAGAVRRHEPAGRLAGRARCDRHRRAHARPGSGADFPRQQQCALHHRRRRAARRPAASGQHRAGVSAVRAAVVTPPTAATARPRTGTPPG